MSTSSSVSQLKLLFSLWWRHMRRRAMRLGATPKLSGAPMFLVFNLFTSGYVVLLVWRAVRRSVGADPAFFAWHMLALLLVALGVGISKGAASMQLRGGRSDAFLEPLPLATLARLGLQFVDTLLFLPAAFVVPIASLSVQNRLGSSSAAPVLLSVIAFVTCFVVGHALSTWVRAVGPMSARRWAGYLGIGFTLIGSFGLYLAFGTFGGLVQLPSAAASFTAWWLSSDFKPYAVGCVLLLVMNGAYRALLAAERYGVDQLDVQRAAPKLQKGVRDRNSLEWLMMLRRGGRPLLVIFTLSLLGALWAMIKFGSEIGKHGAFPLQFGAGFAVYLGAIAILGQAAGAAGTDVKARAFLAALPLAPHEVLEGKARALRWLLLPVFGILGVIGGAAVWMGEGSVAYRIALATLSLYVTVGSAVSIAFLTNGISVTAVGGSQAGSNFSTQLLMMPLFASLLATDAWTATMAFIAVIAVMAEAKRAAKKSVRWLDDPADDVERETTVWRALLAAASFFAIQAMSGLLLGTMELPRGYVLALTYALGAALLVLLTWRNAARFGRPRFLPSRAWYWPLGAFAGGVSGLLALGMVKLVPPPVDAHLPSLSSGEVAALFFTMTVLAPLVEEYFFRGWLQKAIETDLPIKRKHWAFALGGLAFALAHLGSYGVPQLVLGLMAGSLFMYGGGLWPGILAHAVHNGIVLLMAR